ncbi:hypothetical protein ACFU98_41395 [Streptomyces sp. NPDC057575]|uniref:hypothetical protein n=1 Tax=unclassified Streptomyces TaxID=2593676 RepID=UPI0036B124B0
MRMRPGCRWPTATSTVSQKAATEDDLREILAQHATLDDLMRHLPFGERLEGFLLRLAGLQFTWQEDDFSELARSVAMLVQTKPSRSPEVLTAGWEQDLLGCPLADYVGLGLLLYTAATTRLGRFDLAWLPENELTELSNVQPARSQTVLLWGPYPPPAARHGLPASLPGRAAVEPGWAAPAHASL